MDTLTITLDDVLRELRKNHKVPNKELIRMAYDYAAGMHNGQTRKTGEAYIMHPLRVAYLIASWGFDSDVICAAILHDIIEDTSAALEELTNKFGPDIADIVNTVTAIDKEIKDKLGLTKEELDELSDRHLQENMSEKALFVKVADRIDNLRTIDIFPEAKKVAKAKHTREIIIPMLIKEEAFQLIDTLEDLCLKLEHPQRYTDIISTYASLCNGNAYTINKTLKLFSEFFSPANPANTIEFHSLFDRIVDFTYAPRSSISIYRQINAQADNLANDLPRLLSKKNIALYDLTLVISDAYSSSGNAGSPAKLSPLNVFFELYDNFLSSRGITIVDFGRTTYKDSTYHILRDEMNNLYRIFVKSETEYMRYKLGHIIDNDYVTDFSTAGIDGRKIKVFRKDRSSMYIEAGATLLDFAFAIHSELGLHFEYALIDDSLTQHKPYERINEGDAITVVSKPEIEPNLHWFKYVKTSRAVEALVKYFSSSSKKHTPL